MQEQFNVVDPSHFSVMETAALNAVAALGDVSAEAAAAYALGFVAGAVRSCSGAGVCGQRSWMYSTWCAATCVRILGKEACSW